LADIAAGNGPVRWRLALGYSGWDAGQLEEELTRHGWLIADCDKEVLFAAPPEELWQAAYRSAGIDPAMLSSGFGAA
jgi:putative transcriptional regulator